MSLKFEWRDKQDGVDDILSEDINSIARAVIESEEKIENLFEKISGGASVKIVQETGYSTISVMSQAATTKALNRKFDEQRTFIDWKKDIESQYEYDEVYNEAYRGTYQFGTGLYDVYYSSDSGANLAVATFEDFSASTPNFDNENFDLSQIIVTGDSKSVYLYISREPDFTGYPVMDFFTTGDGYENFLLDISKSVYNGKTHLFIDVKHIVNGEPISVSGVDIVQEKGTSETAVMSQDATTRELDGKLDKVTDTKWCPRVYGVSANGVQQMVDWHWAPTEESLAYRTTGGALAVGTPTADTHAVPLGYANEHYLPKVENKHGINMCYVIKADGTGGLIGIGYGAPTEYTLVARTVGGVVVVGEPKADNHAANKGYVDELIANLQAQIDALKQ